MLDFNVNQHSNLIIKKLQSVFDINRILLEFSDAYTPPLATEISDLGQYAKKLYSNAEVYILKTKQPIGFVAFYANNNETKTGYIAQIAVKPLAQNIGIGKRLLKICYSVSRKNGMNKLKLEVKNVNQRAIEFYKNNGFRFCGEASTHSMYMIKGLS